MFVSAPLPVIDVSALVAGDEPVSDARSGMTRLRQRERLVLDTLFDADVARSRSEALVWAVRLVGKQTEEWLT